MDETAKIHIEPTEATYYVTEGGHPHSLASYLDGVLEQARTDSPNEWAKLLGKRLDTRARNQGSPLTDTFDGRIRHHYTITSSGTIQHRASNDSLSSTLDSDTLESTDE